VNLQQDHYRSENLISRTLSCISLIMQRGVKSSHTACLSISAEWLTFAEFFAIRLAMRPDHVKVQPTDTTLDDGYLGSELDEGRSELRYVSRLADIWELTSY